MKTYTRKGPHYLVAIDPGKRKAGISVWYDGRLIAAECVKAPPSTMHKALINWAMEHCNVGDGPVYWVLEVMQDYRRGNANASGIPALKAMLARLSKALGCAVVWTATPSVWKGNVPKDIHHRRIQKYLTPEEVTVAGAYQHDKHDAIALGLTALQRCGRGGTKIK